MARDSKLMAEIKEEQMLLNKNLSPAERLKIACEHNQFIKELRFAGLSKKGFTKEQIEKLNSQNYNE